MRIHEGEKITPWASLASPLAEKSVSVQGWHEPAMQESLIWSISIKVFSPDLSPVHIPSVRMSAGFDFAMGLMQVAPEAFPRVVLRAGITLRAREDFIHVLLLLTEHCGLCLESDL